MVRKKRRFFNSVLRRAQKARADGIAFRKLTPSQKWHLKSWWAKKGWITKRSQKKGTGIRFPGRPPSTPLRRTVAIIKKGQAIAPAGDMWIKGTIYKNDEDKRRVLAIRVPVSTGTRVAQRSEAAEALTKMDTINGLFESVEYEIIKPQKADDYYTWDGSNLQNEKFSSIRYRKKR